MHQQLGPVHVELTASLVAMHVLGVDASGKGVFTQFPAGSQPSVVQGFVSEQFFSVPGTHFDTNGEPLA